MVCVSLECSSWSPVLKLNPPSTTHFPGFLVCACPRGYSVPLFPALSALKARGQFATFGSRLRSFKTALYSLSDISTMWAFAACLADSMAISCVLSSRAVTRLTSSIGHDPAMRSRRLDATSNNHVLDEMRSFQRHSRYPKRSLTTDRSPLDAESFVDGELPESIHSSPRQQRRRAVLMMARRKPFTWSHVHASTTSTL